MSSTRKLAAVSAAASVLLVTALAAGCTSWDESGLSLREAKLGFAVSSLYCHGPGPLLAAGLVVKGDAREGAVFSSEDRGLTWRRARLQPLAGEVPLAIWGWRTAGGARLYVQPFRAAQLSSGAQALSKQQESGPWWTTADAGHSWTRGGPALPPAVVKGYYLSNHFNRPFVADPQGTVLSSAYGNADPALLRSTDGGATWEARVFQGDFFIQFAGDGAGKVFLLATPPPPFLGRWEKRAYVSTDSGATWTNVPTGSSGGNAVDLIWIPGGTLLMAYAETLGRPPQTVILHSKDEGRTWSLSTGTGNAGGVAGLASDASGRVIAITLGGNILLSDDGGVSWRQAGRPTTKGVGLSWITEIADDGHVAILLKQGVVLRSTNRGDSWSVVETGAWRFQRNFCTDRKGLILLVDEVGAIYRSDDWGATWRPGRLAD